MEKLGSDEDFGVSECEVFILFLFHRRWFSQLSGSFGFRAMAVYGFSGSQAMAVR
jgi:hypothetical protein